MGCGIKTWGITKEIPKIDNTVANNDGLKPHFPEQERKHPKRKLPLIDCRLGDVGDFDAPTALITNKQKSEIDLNLIKNSLIRHFIFNSLTDEQRAFVIEQMKHYSLKPNSVIFEQHQSGKNFFVIIMGKCEVRVNGKRVNTLKTGDSFGELALLHDTPRSATVRTLEKCTLWALDRKTFRDALEALNATNYSENHHFINSVPLFQILTPGQKEALVCSLTSHKFSNGQRIVNEGDPGDLFYIIKDGTVSCISGDREIRKMGKGDFFGEQSLLYNSPRTATVIAIDDVRCVAIWRENLTKVLGSHLQQIIYRNSIRIALDRSSVLSKLIKSQSDALISNMKIESFQKGDVVIKGGDLKSHALWIVLKGNIAKKNGDIYAMVFDCIADEEVITEKCLVFEEDLVASGDVDIALIYKTEFETCIGGKYEHVTNNNEALKVLKQIQLLRSLSVEKTQDLLQILKIEKYADKQIIVRQNNPGDSLFIIKSGKVDVYKDDQKIRAITKHDYFGERSVLFDDFRSATVLASGEVNCWVISKSDFMTIIDDQIRVQLLKRIELQDDSIMLSDLSPVKVLGKGMFGIVTLVTHNITLSVYALKSVDRLKIRAYDLQECLVLERKILLGIDHVFIVKLIKTFKDNERVYFLMEFVRGMDLFDVLRLLGILSEKDAKFYLGCMVYVLEHLHDRDIIYRDIKPENIMIDEDGYPKLIDFGTAKIVIGRTYTIVGTPHYMAPELITGKGYNISVDFWSLGCMLYEFICGGVPFGDDEEEPYNIYKSILEGKIIYPQWSDISQNAKNILDQLLSKNPGMRTGGSVDILKSHPWLSSIDWDKLVCKLLKAPFIPAISDFKKEAYEASKRNFNLNQFISYEEEPLQASTSRRRQVTNDLWDAEF